MEKILQIGEGNFLRAFFDYYVQLANDLTDYNGKVVICQPRTNNKVINALNAQNCNYDVILRGRHCGEVVDKRVAINCVSRCIDSSTDFDSVVAVAKSDNTEIIVSNTTEAGIAFNSDDKIDNLLSATFPAKLAFLLYNRYLANGKDIVILPVELIDNNGDALKKCILQYGELFAFGDGFADYVNTKCHFCNTLVDRIVTGYPVGDADPCAVACEPYESFVIQADDYAKSVLPFGNIGQNIVYTNDITPFKTRKVRILNGTHTMSVLAAYMCGISIVRDMMQNDAFSAYISQCLEEIKTTINLDESELDSFASAVLERFDNPFIDHKLTDIALNSVSKYTARCLSTVKDYINKFDKAPKILSFALAALLHFYYTQQDVVRDSQNVLDAFASSDNIKDVMQNQSLWGEDLTAIKHFYDQVLYWYNQIVTDTINNAINKVINNE